MRTAPSFPRGRLRTNQFCEAFAAGQVRRERETGAMRLRRRAMRAAVVLLLSAAFAAPAAARIFEVSKTALLC